MVLIIMMMSAHHYSHQSRFARPNLLEERRRGRRRLSLKQDVDWAGNRVAQLQSHVQDVEDSENDDGLLDCVNRKTRMNMMTPIMMTMMMMGRLLGVFVTSAKSYVEDGR